MVKVDELPNGQAWKSDRVSEGLGTQLSLFVADEHHRFLNEATESWRHCKGLAGDNITFWVKTYLKWTYFSFPVTIRYENDFLSKQQLIDASTPSAIRHW